MNTDLLAIMAAIIYAVVGWAGMSLVTFLILDVIGSLLWAGMLAGLGYSIGQPAVGVAKIVAQSSAAREESAIIQRSNAGNAADAVGAEKLFRHEEGPGGSPRTNNNRPGHKKV